MASREAISKEATRQSGHAREMELIAQLLPNPTASFTLWTTQHCFLCGSHSGKIISPQFSQFPQKLLPKAVSKLFED